MAKPRVCLAGDLFYYFLQMVWAIYNQLAAMKVLPQFAAGEASVLQSVN